MVPGSLEATWDAFFGAKPQSQLSKNKKPHTLKTAEPALSLPRNGWTFPLPGIWVNVSSLMEVASPTKERSYATSATIRLTD